MGFWDKFLGSSTARKTGYDCPFYAAEKCRAGGGDNLCSLGPGHYWTDCHVYRISGLEGEYKAHRAKCGHRTPADQAT